MEKSDTAPCYERPYECLSCLMGFLGAGTRCWQDWDGEQRRQQPVHTQHVNQRQLPEQFCQQSDGRLRRQERGGHGGRPHGHVRHTPQAGTTS